MWIWITKLRMESWLFVCSLQQMRTTVMGRWTKSLVHHWQETQTKGWSHVTSPPPSLCCWPSISPPSLVRAGICIHHFLHCAVGHLFPLALWWELVYVFTTSFIVLLAIYFPSLTGESWYMYSPLPSLCCWPSISPRSLVRVGIYVFTISFIVLLAIYFPSLTGESWYTYWPPSLCCWPSISPAFPSITSKIWYLYVHLVVQIVSVICLPVSPFHSCLPTSPYACPD